MARPINVVIKGDYTDRDINRAIRDLERLKTQGSAATGAFGGFANSLKGFGAGLVASIGFTEIVHALTAMSQAAMDDEVKMASLAKTLENVGQGFKQTGVEDFISKMQLATGVADNDLRNAFQKIVTVTGDVEKSQTALKLAMDISAGTGKDLESVSAALAKGYGGQTTALQRLGVGIDAATLKSKNMNAITDALSQKFGGQAAVAAQTYQGQMNRITQAVGEAQEAIGYALLNAIDSTTRSLGGTDGLVGLIVDATDKINTFSEAGQRANSSIEDLARSIPGVSKDATTLSLGWGYVKNIFLQTLGPLGSTIKLLDQFGAIKFVQDLIAQADAADRAAHYTSDLALEHEHLARASMQAGKGVSDLGDDTEDAGLKAYEAAKSFQDFWKSAANLSNQQQTFRDLMNTSGTVGSELFKAALDDIGKAADDAGSKVGKVGDGASGAGAKAEELAIKWKQAAASITADVEGLKITMGGGGEVIAGNLVTAFQNRLGAFRQIVSEQVGIVQQARQALDSYAQSITDTIMGKINFSTVDPTTNQPLSPEQIVQMMLGDITNQQNAVTAIAGIAQQLPPALTQRIMALPPDAAIALANYLAANPALLEQLTLAYQALADFTEITLGVPMAKAFATVGGKSATSMIADAKKTINDEAAAFQDFVESKLSAKVKVKVVWESSPWDPEGRAVGGPVTGGTPYLVGERGPELFVPDSAGVIVPNHDLGGGGAAGGSTYHITVNAAVGDPRAIGRSVVEAITLYERSSGPVFARA